MKQLSNYLKEESVNESLILGALGCWALLEYACFPLISGMYKKLKDKHADNVSKANSDSGGGSKGGDSGSGGGSFSTYHSGEGNGNFFTNFFTKKNKDGQVEGNTENFNKLMMIAKEANKKEEDENQKKKNDSMMKLLTACSFDKDGNEIPLEDRLDKMKDVLPPDTDIEAWKKEMEEGYNKIKDDPKFKKDLEEAAKSVKSADLDKYVEDAKKEAKQTLKEVEDKKKEIEEQKKELERIEQESKDAAGQKAKELNNQKESIKDKIAKITAGGVVGGLMKIWKKPNSDTNTNTDTNTTKEPKDEPKDEPKPKDDDDVDDSDVEGGLSDDDNAEIEKAGAKGAEKPKEPRKVKKRPLERGEGSCYYYADDPDKQSIGAEGKEAIKAYVKYKKALAAWKKNNEGSTNESLMLHLRRMLCS